VINLSDWLDKHEAFSPSKIALRFEGKEITYGEFATTVRDHARALKHVLGLGRGDRLAYLGMNTPEFLFVMFACARIGVIFSPLNWRLVAAEHLYILKDSAPKILMCDSEYQARGEELKQQLPDIELVASDFEADGWQRLAEAVATAEGDDRNPHVAPETPYLLVYTSGTTGRPKGAVLTQEAMLVNALNGVHLGDISSHDHILTPLPLFHVGGMNNQTTPAFYAGATVTLHRRFDPQAVLDALLHERITLTCLVPATLLAVSALPGWKDAWFPQLKTVLSGSSIVPLTLINEYHDKGVPISQMYGATETCPIAIYLRAEDAIRKVGSTGKAAMHCEMRIVDDNSNDVETGTPGEILIKGKNVLYEHWGNEEATRESLRDGWYYTGDVGYQDDEGYVWINDRKKDVIISGGENIYPAELEQVIYRMDDIEDGTVVGRPDDRWGEVPVAVVIPKTDPPEAPEFLARFEDQLARYKHPKDVIFVDDLPRNAMGKILKHEVRDMVKNT